MMKKILKSIACVVIALAIIIPITYSRTKAETHTCQDMHVMQESLITPDSTEQGKDEWNRDFEDTDEGLRVTYGSGVTHPKFKHNTRNAVATDGLHTKLTFHRDPNGTCDPSRTFYIWFSTANDNEVTGLSFKVQLSSGQLYCYVDDHSIDHSGYADYRGDIATDRIFMSGFDTSAITAEIRTEITEDEDFVFTINGYDFVVAKEVWQASTNMGDGKNLYVKVGPAGKALDFTWNYLHGGKEVCYDIHQDAESVKLNIDKVKMADVYPNNTKTDWESARTIEETDDGIRIAYKVNGNNLAYRHRINSLVPVDGAHMKLTVNSTDTADPKDARVNIYITDDLDKADKGITLRFSIRENQLRLEINNAEQDLKAFHGKDIHPATDYALYIPSVFAKENPALEIKSSVTSDGDVVFLINGYEFKVPSTVLANATGLSDLSNAYIMVGPREGKLDFTWHSFHGGNEICPEELAEIIGEDMTQKIATAITKIREITRPITENSAAQIDAAKVAIEAVPKKYISYIGNMEDYEAAVEQFEGLQNVVINLDPSIYPVVPDDVGPVSASWANSVKIYEAESGVGVTVEYINTTVHQVGINRNNKVALDNLHMQFANFESNWEGHKFAFIFSNAEKADVQSSDALLWLIFTVNSNRIRVDVDSTGDMPEFNIIDTYDLGASSLKDTWSVNLDQLPTGEFELTLCDTVAAIIPQDYMIKATNAGLNLDACYVTYSAFNFAGTQHTAKMDILSIHSGDDECYARIEQEEYEATQDCKALIDAIGTVTVDSEDAINAATEAYDALPDNLKGLITNKVVLDKAIRAFSNIHEDTAAAELVIEAINKLPAKASDATYEQLIDCYSKYLDLYPRARKFVTNADKLLEYVAAYEEAHPGVELKQETVNEYTGGKNAHYNKK